MLEILLLFSPKFLHTSVRPNAPATQRSEGTSERARMSFQLYSSLMIISNFSVATTANAVTRKKFKAVEKVRDKAAGAAELSGESFFIA